MIQVSTFATLVCLVCMFVLGYLNNKGDRFANSEQGLTLTGLFVVGFFAFGTILVGHFIYHTFIS